MTIGSAAVLLKWQGMSSESSVTQTCVNWIEQLYLQYVNACS